MTIISYILEALKKILSKKYFENHLQKSYKKVWCFDLHPYDI